MFSIVKNNTFPNSGLCLSVALYKQGRIFLFKQNPKNWVLKLDRLAEIVENRA